MWSHSNGTLRFHFNGTLCYHGIGTLWSHGIGTLWSHSIGTLWSHSNGTVLWGPTPMTHWDLNPKGGTFTTSEGVLVASNQIQEIIKQDRVASLVWPTLKLLQICSKPQLHGYPEKRNDQINWWKDINISFQSFVLAQSPITLLKMTNLKICPFQQLCSKTKLLKYL